jgi:hypothetical protein
MALNLSDKKAIARQLLPEIEINAASNGITISASERLSTPRFIPFEHNGRCKACKSTEVEADFAVSKEGVTVFCNRIKGSHFVPFDVVYDLPGHTFFKASLYLFELNYPKMFSSRTKDMYSALSTGTSQLFARPKPSRFQT